LFGNLRDVEIARSVELKKIKQVAESIGIPREEVENYGRYIAKIPEQLIVDTASYFYV